MAVCKEPFIYLRSHVGNHTKVENFIIEFYAGLARYDGMFGAVNVAGIPEDISRHLQHRQMELASQNLLGDNIVNDLDRFKVTRSDYTRRSVLQVLPPLKIPGPDYVELLGLGLLESSTSLTRTNKIILPISRSLPVTPIKQAPCHEHRVRLSVPGIASIGGDPEVLVSRSLVQALSLLEPARPSHRRASSASDFVNRAPFMDNAAVRRRSLQLLAQGESSDDDSEDGSSCPNFRAREDSHQADVVDGGKPS